MRREFARQYGLPAEHSLRVLRDEVKTCLGWKRPNSPLKRFTLHSPTGEVFADISNLAKFCRDHQLVYPSIQGLVTGRVESLHSWPRDDSKPKRYIAVSPDGQQHHITQLKQFSDTHGLTYRTVQRVLRGDRQHHRQWRSTLTPFLTEDASSVKRPRASHQSHRHLSDHPPHQPPAPSTPSRSTTGYNTSEPYISKLIGKPCGNGQGPNTASKRPRSQWCDHGTRDDAATSMLLWINLFTLQEAPPSSRSTLSLGRNAYHGLAMIDTPDTLGTAAPESVKLKSLAIQLHA